MGEPFRPSPPRPGERVPSRQERRFNRYSELYTSKSALEQTNALHQVRYLTNAYTRGKDEKGAANAPYQALNTAFLADTFGVSTSEVGKYLTTYRQQYARQHFGQPFVDDQKFYELVGQQFQAQKAVDKSLEQLPGLVSGWKFRQNESNHSKACARYCMNGTRLSFSLFRGPAVAGSALAYQLNGSTPGPRPHPVLSSSTESPCRDVSPRRLCRNE